MRGLSASLLNRVRFTVTALRCSPFFQQWAEGMQERGKSKMSVICAVMRKLVHLAYGVLKNGKPFDPEWAKTA
jgi:transposase